MRTSTHAIALLAVISVTLGGCSGEKVAEKPQPVGRPRPGAVRAGPMAAGIETVTTPEGRLQFARDRIQQLNMMRAGRADSGDMTPETIETELYAAFIQAGEATQELLNAGKTDLDEDFGGLLYNYACALSREGELEKAKEVLVQSIDYGFANLKHIEEDTDLQALQAADDWKQFREGLSAKIEKAMGLEIEKQFAAFKPFDFKFDLPTVDGEQLSLESLKGSVVVADIWGTWCPPCRQEVPHFIELQNQYAADGLKIVGLNYERAETEEQKIAKIKEFVAQTGINYPLVLGDEVTQTQVPDFRGYPTTLFIDREGKVRFLALGYHDKGYLELIIRKLLDEKAGEPTEPAEAPKSQEA